MKLTELDPRWCTFMAHPAPGVNVRTGLSFLCPHCKVQRLAVMFEPAIDLDGTFAKFGILWPCGASYVWHRTGDSFETLTLSPSINCEGNPINFPGHWHGRITNGEIH